MSGTEFLSIATLVSLIGLGLSMGLMVVRIVFGPTLPDRVLALDSLTLMGLCFVCVFAIRTGSMLYLDVALGLSLLGFLATVAFARYILRRAERLGVLTIQDRKDQP